MSVKDQPGKDPEIRQGLLDRNVYEALPGPSGKMLISVTDKRSIDHHVIVPILKSYEAAMAIAVNHLGMPDVGPDYKEVSFAYRMKSPSGDIVWAKLLPEFWNEFVRDGD